MKALGIIAMIFAIISIFVPVVDPYLTILCALLAAFAGGPGLTFGAVAIGVNLLNVSFLSPSLWLMAGAAAAETQGSGSDILLGMGGNVHWSSNCCSYSPYDCSFSVEETADTGASTSLTSCATIVPAKKRPPLHSPKRASHWAAH